MTHLLFLPVALAAETTLEPEAQFRPRFEADTGRDFNQDAGDVAFITHRARLGGTLATGPVEVRILFQDVRSWGEELDTRRDFAGNGIDLGIGTLAWHPHEHVSLLLGRQEVVLHDERLVARAHWRQPGRRFDGARLAWNDGTWVAEAAGFLVVDSDRFLFDVQDQVEPSPGGDHTLWFARAGRETDDVVAQAVVVLDVRRQVVGEEVFRPTPGVFLKGTQGVLTGQFEAYGQFGTLAGGDRSVRAAQLVATGTFAPDLGSRPQIGIGYAMISGDSTPDDDVSTAFNPLFSANHKHWGTQDIALFFRGGPAGGQGLHDPSLRLGIEPVDRISVQLTQHLFAPVAGESFVALEPDLSVKASLTDGVNLIAGASVWAEIDDGNRPVEQFAFLMLDAQLKGPKLGGS